MLGDRGLPSVEPGTRVTVAGARHYHLPVSHCVEKQLALEHAGTGCTAWPRASACSWTARTNRPPPVHVFQAEIEWHTESVDEVYDTIESVLGPLRRQGLIADWRVTAASTRRGPARQALADAPYESCRSGRPADRVAGVGGAPNPHAPVTSPMTRRASCRGRRGAVLADRVSRRRAGLAYRRRPDGTFATYDLVLPAGHGELATGGLRPDSAEDARRQASAFTDRAHPTTPRGRLTRLQTGGIGFGVERLIRYCSGAESVLDLRAAHDHGPNAAIGV